MEAVQVKNTTLEIIKGDITKVEVEAIVNAANNSLLGGGGVDGAIHRAGGKTILAECLKINQEKGGCPTGEAVITTAGDLPAKYVIHTVGPVWHSGQHNEEEELRFCYRNSLLLADKYRLQSIAFPNISTGVYHYPKAKAAEVALKEVIQYLEAKNTSVQRIIFVCFDQENLQLYREKIKKYV